MGTNNFYSSTPTGTVYVVQDYRANDCTQCDIFEQCAEPYDYSCDKENVPQEITGNAIGDVWDNLLCDLENAGFEGAICNPLDNHGALARNYPIGDSYEVWATNPNTGLSQVHAVLEYRAGYYTDGNINIYDCDTLHKEFGYEREDLSFDDDALQDIIRAVADWTCTIRKVAQTYKGKAFHEVVV